MVYLIKTDKKTIDSYPDEWNHIYTGIHPKDIDPADPMYSFYHHYSIYHWQFNLFQII